MSDSEIVTVEPMQTMARAEPLPVNPWVGIIQQSIDKGTDITAIEKFIKLQREEEDRQAERAFNSSLSRLQGMMPEISKNGTASFATKNGGNMSYNFDQLSDICNALRPLLQDTGLSYSFKQIQDNGGITVQCTIKHNLGHELSNQMTAPADQTGNKNTIQQIGSTIKYLQRYTIKSAFGISSVDDDGAASTKYEAEKVSSGNFLSWKATFAAEIESRKTLEECEAYKNESVNYTAKHEPAFCTEIYNKFEEIKKQKGW